jgi:hypothetical protein
MSDTKQANGTSLTGQWLRDYDLGHLHSHQGSIDYNRNRLSSGYRTGISDFTAGIRVWTGSVVNPQTKGDQP